MAQLTRNAGGVRGRGNDRAAKPRFLSEKEESFSFSYATGVFSEESSAGDTSAKSHKTSNGSTSSKSGKQGDRYNAEIGIQFSGCDYELTFSFNHDESLPVPTNPEQCNPAVQPSDIASDGLPYFAPRIAEYPFSNKIYEATGLASHSLDFNPCGHPPMGIFDGPHYDSHFYTKSATVREKWTCAQPPGAPICTPQVQETASGRAFFNIATIFGTDNALSNMPLKFECDVEAAVPKQGTHCWDFATNPDSVSDWSDPVLIMGSYDADIAFLEPMYPRSFVTGDTNNSYNANVVYEGQTIETLPKEYSIDYIASTGRTTIVLKGTRAACDI
eukprot:CAMPEP_0172313474 /NCGR_PEP_ID=MMETSP1058-20130122/20258_1 /TAXON_ID=83371 /ORGANISM="Detonula confervacea, Strain CCMP 353" /LENGTH=329 /DNA_ID=CAMNT_0013027129 /DNA_START=161 /DNA_END=1150 /DNA_ORIENTATION=-